MTLTLSPNALNLLQQTSIEPNIVLTIDGFDETFGAVGIRRNIRIGDEGLEVGDDWVIGGFTLLEDQKPYISLSGSSTSIRQQLEPDRGAVSSISSVVISLIDKNLDVTRLISPGVEVTDILNRKAKVYMGFRQGSFPEDYVLIFAGVVSDINSGAGLIDLTINHPDEKKRQDIFTRWDTELNGAINNSTTSINLVSASGLLLPQDALTTYIRIGDEVIRYTGVSGNSLTGVSRGQLGTSAVSHDDESPVSSYYVIEGIGIELALKIMLSGFDGPYVTGVPVRSMGQEGLNGILFEDLQFNEKYGLNTGDLITVSGADNGANNFSERTVVSVTEIDQGSVVVVDGAALVSEAGTSAVASFRSQFDTLGTGLRMTPAEVDVAEHLNIRNTFLSSTNMRFLLKDTEEGKEFIEKQIYMPQACYSLPRQARSSIGIHINPIPKTTILTLNKNNIKNPSRIKLRRSLGKNFYNVIIYKYDEKVLEDEFDGGRVYVDAQSVSDLGRRKPFLIDARGFTTANQAAAITNTAAQRRLQRYRRGAEFIDNIEVLFRIGARIEAGDIVILDPADLQISNTLSGNRDKPARFFEVINKSINLRTGAVTLSITDTNFDGANRYGLISPASEINQVLSPTSVIIRPSFSKKFLTEEWRKWLPYIGASVIVRSADFSSSETTNIAAVDGNRITFSSAISPSADYIIEMNNYNSQPDLVKLVYTFMSDGENDFADDGAPYRMI